MASELEDSSHSVGFKVSHQNYHNLLTFMTRQEHENIQQNLTDVTVTIKQENWPNWDYSNKTQVLKKEQDFENSSQMDIKNLFAHEQKVKEETNLQCEKSFTKEESAAVDQVKSQEKTGCDFDPSKVNSERASPKPEPLAYVDVTEVQPSGKNGFSRNSNIQNEKPGNLGTDISGHVPFCQIGRDGNTEDKSPVDCCHLPVSQCELLERNVDEIIIDDVNNSMENSEDKQKNHASCNTQTESKTSHQSEEKETNFLNVILTSTQDNEIISNEKCNGILNTETNGHRIGKNIMSDDYNVSITSLSCVQLLLKCDDCGKKVSSFSHLRRHIKSHLEINESFTCNEIQKTTRKHRKGCRKKRSYKCDTCNADLSSISCLRSHLDTHTSGKLYKCEDCGNKCTYFSHLKKHINSHLFKLMSRSNNLDSSFSAESTMQTRKLKRNREACYKCDVCCLTFSSRSCLVRHTRKHTQDETYTSNIGCADYFSKNVISKRKPAHTVDETYVCDLCSAIFTYNSNLQRHKKLHTNPKSFICDICGLGFMYSYNMIEHKRIHTGEKPHICHTCSASFSCKSNLNRHQKVHTAEKLFLCDFCGAAFTWHGHLREHERTHTGEKPYKCDVCGVKFAAHGHLKKHRVIHTGERNYKCGTCGKRFCRQSNLRSHERIHKRK